MCQASFSALYTCFIISSPQHPHFRDEETGAQRSTITCSQSHSARVSWDWNPGPPDAIYTNTPHPELPEKCPHRNLSPVTHVHMDTGRIKGQWGWGPKLLLTQDLLCAENVTHDVRTPVSIAEGTIPKEDLLGAPKTRDQELGPWRNQGKLLGGGDI